MHIPHLKYNSVIVCIFVIIQQVMFRFDCVAHVGLIYSQTKYKLKKNVKPQHQFETAQSVPIMKKS